ncbi:hypothetical protein HMPREF0058_0687 [Actinomyces urogenitalis DSM 15434]|uniref:Uncharacterized protein n=1 Tax=Actinomyces urogenitalis DSM 15434 TaxID=525246 RepID=C0W493_9ACTO|nr:hypothetical protein HMPREF0058_0687 [Actinomyces urogenitalis DSM 15434]
MCADVLSACTSLEEADHHSHLGSLSPVDEGVTGATCGARAPWPRH